jgi:hypothetical protein
VKGWGGPERLLEITTGEEERCDTYIWSLKRLKGCSIWRCGVSSSRMLLIPDGGSIDQLRRLHWGEE